jgi:hypothetical protein
MGESTTEQTTHKHDRTYKTVLDFVHEVQDALDDNPEFDLTGVCEADEVYVVAGEKGLDRDEPRDRGLKKERGTFESDKPPVVTFVRENLADGDEDIVEYGDEDDPAILCTDQDSISDGTDESDEIDVHPVINHDEHYVVGDAHTNSCENRHSFLCNLVGKVPRRLKTPLTGLFELLQPHTQHRPVVRENPKY